MARIETVGIRLIEKTFDKPVGGSSVNGVDIIVADLRDGDGCTGMGFSYVIGGLHGGVVANLAERQAERFLTGRDLKDPQAHWREIQTSFNRTGDGPNVLALAALDVALWDLTARRANVPLATALGGAPVPVPVYASGGFSPTAMPKETAEVALAHLAAGFRAVKPRVNARAGDTAVLAAVRAAVGDDAGLMADANEKGDFASAARLLAEAADQGVQFVEEPLPAWDLRGYRKLTELTGGAPVAMGEHLQGLDRFQMALDGGALAAIQPDLAMAGGLTPCLQVARDAAALGVTVAPHFLPGLFVHLAGAFGGTLLLEDFPLVESAFEGWPEIRDGQVLPRGTAGHGLTVRA